MNGMKMFFVVALSSFALAACGVGPEADDAQPGAAPSELAGDSSPDESTPERSALASKTVCGLLTICSAGYYPASYTTSSSCPGPINKPNATVCQSTGAIEFRKCGIGACPSGYYDKGSYDYSGLCGQGNPNRTLCRKNGT